MASDGSVTLDMSIDSEQLEKSIDELNATIEKFAESSVDSLSSIDDKMSELATYLYNTETKVSTVCLFFHFHP